jgi:hypothetical protein
VFDAPGAIPKLCPLRFDLHAGLVSLLEQLGHGTVGRRQADNAASGSYVAAPACRAAGEWPTADADRQCEIASATCEKPYVGLSVWFYGGPGRNRTAIRGFADRVRFGQYTEIIGMVVGPADGRGNP